MICKNCGGQIPHNVIRCPYCNMTIAEMDTKRVHDDIELKERKKQLDRLFGLDIDYVSMKTEDLENFFSKIFENLEKHDTNDTLIKDDLDKIMAHIENVESELQKRQQKEIDANNLKCQQMLEKIGTENEKYQQELEKSNNQKVNSKSKNVEIVYDLIKQYEKPQLNLAAYAIRGKTERLLRDYYKMPYINNPPKGEIPHFEKKYYQMYIEVTKNPAVAKELVEGNNYLNKFIHQCKGNDEIIKQKYPTIESQSKFLLDTYELRKKYKLA